MQSDFVVLLFDKLFFQLQIKREEVEMTMRMEMAARVERIKRTPKDCRHTISVDNEAFLRMEYTSGAVLTEKLFTGAVAVIRGDARILNWRKKPIPPTLMVICRRNCFNGAVKKFLFGAPVQVVNPGEDHSFLVLLKGAESNPIIAKSMCRPVGKCTDTNESCGNCCNRKKTRT